MLTVLNIYSTGVLVTVLNFSTVNSTEHIQYWCNANCTEHTTSCYILLVAVVVEFNFHTLYTFTLKHPLGLS